MLIIKIGSRVPILIYSQQDDSSYITVILLYSTSKGLYSKLLCS